MSTASENIVGAIDLLLMAVLIIIATVSAVLVYRSMQRPRLAIYTEQGRWRTRPAHVLIYVASVPFLVLFWWSVLFFILLLTNTPLDGIQTIAITGSIILAVRILAHVWREPAHELGKSIPLTLITLVLISGGIRDADSFIEVVDEAAGVDITVQAIALLVMADWVITALWYFIGVQWLASEQVRVPGVPPRPPWRPLTALRARQRAAEPDAPEIQQSR